MCVIKCVCDINNKTNTIDTFLYWIKRCALSHLITIKHILSSMKVFLFKLRTTIT